MAEVPEPIAASAVAEGKLVQLLERFASTTPSASLHYPSRRQRLPKLPAFIDHVQNCPVVAVENRIPVGEGSPEDASEAAASVAETVRLAPGSNL